MSNSYLSTLICRQAKKYGDRVALKYRNYETESWIPVSWNQFAAKVKNVSNALIALGTAVQENVGIFSQNMPECLYTDFGAFGSRVVTIHCMPQVRKHKYTIYWKMRESVSCLWVSSISMMWLIGYRIYVSH